MVPFYTFYSMFGFQRIGDLIWQAADMRTRGFLMAATAGRTTLMGEGLQHQDGHSLVLASTVPFVQAYDPAFAYEVGAIVQAGMNRMFGGGPPEATDVFYYITLYNENYEMPPMPDTPRPRRGDRRRPLQVGDAPVRSVDSGDPAVLRVRRTAAREAAANSPSTTTSAPSCGRPRRTSRCAKRRWRPSVGTGCTRRRSLGFLGWRRSSASCAVRCGGVRLHEDRARADPAVGA